MGSARSGTRVVHSVPRFTTGVTWADAAHPGLTEGKFGEDAGGPVELKIVAGQNLSDLNIRLMPPAAISGRVRDEDRLQSFSSAEVNDAVEFRAEHLPPAE